MYSPNSLAKESYIVWDRVESAIGPLRKARSQMREVWMDTLAGLKAARKVKEKEELKRGVGVSVPSHK